MISHILAYSVRCNWLLAPCICILGVSFPMFTCCLCSRLCAFIPYFDCLALLFLRFPNVALNEMDTKVTTFETSVVR